MQEQGIGEEFAPVNEMSEPKKITVLVVDDHPIMRIGIAAIIQATPDMTTVAQAGSGEEAIELYEKYLPDIALVDLRLPGISGVAVIRTLMARHRNAKFVVLTTYEGDEDIHQALEAGARSYIIKGMPHGALVERSAPRPRRRAFSAHARQPRSFFAPAGFGVERTRARSARLDRPRQKQQGDRH